MNFEELIDEPILPIRTAAKMLNVSVHTLRMYEREGLIIPSKTEGNQRAYSKSDLERIECIRKAINELKISINGIKTIYSLIPCWNVVNCSDLDRKNCKAFDQHSSPCWTYKHRKNICAKLDCRDCAVYKENSNCGKVKELIKDISRK